MWQRDCFSSVFADSAAPIDVIDVFANVACEEQSHALVDWEAQGREARHVLQKLSVAVVVRVGVHVGGQHNQR